MGLAESMEGSESKVEMRVNISGWYRFHMAHVPYRSSNFAAK